MVILGVGPDVIPVRSLSVDQQTMEWMMRLSFPVHVFSDIRPAEAR